MALVGVQAVKVVFGQLHLRPIQHGKAHAHKDVLDLVQGDIHGMLVAQLDRLAGDSHIKRLVPELLLQGLLFQLPGGCLNGPFQSGPDLVGQLAHGGSLLGGEGAHTLQHIGELSLLAQVLNPEGIQGGGIGGPLDGRKGLRPDVR